MQGRGRVFWIASTLLILGVALYYSLFTLAHPYHLDTVLYLQGIETFFSEGRMGRPLPARFGNSWLYLPAVAAFGEGGIRVANVLIVIAFSALYLVVVRREFEGAVAWAAALAFLSVPATVLSVTHGKEDLNALLGCAAALALMRDGATWPRMLAAGVLFGLALMCKEFPLIVAPFFLLHGFLVMTRPETWEDWVRGSAWRQALPGLLAFIAGAALVVGILSPRHLEIVLGLQSSAHAGRFLGPFSSMQGFGWRAWQEALLHLHPFELLALVALIPALRAARFRTLLWSGAALVSFVLLSNTTVLRARGMSPALFFLLPVSALGLQRLLEVAAGLLWQPERARGLTTAALGTVSVCLAAAQLLSVTPTLVYRRDYPPQKSFFEAVGRELPKDSLLFGMDNCALATYYTGLACRTHPVDPDPAEAQAFVDELEVASRAHPVYLLPDFFAYDLREEALKRTLEREMRLSPAFEPIGEPYHLLTYAPTIEQALDGIAAEHPDCSLAGRTSKPFPVGESLVLDHVRFEFRCPSSSQTVTALAFRGRRTFLEPQAVWRVEPRRKR